ncbi:hypothetical protein SASPL_132389 [Salvia splendens]|uniref:DNA repair protein RAD16 n=1 Tax=Salvia splendens TaxID=180675 RepID=A0A8X8X118_SALSN|nr:ATP-dependent helicase rhp16-like [Salvia splendens]KAG6404813.1 hypothetical protein SASPL_132389 [Salvia splendens]
MKFRSHGDGASSSKGKEKINYRESSDSEDDEEAPSDVGEIEEQYCGNIDSHSASDPDGLPKRRKTESYVKAGSQSSEKAEEEEREDDTQIVARILADLAGDIIERKLRPTLYWKELEQENDRWIEENWQTDFDQVNQNEIRITVEPSDDLIIPLLRYQKEWLAWALGQEESSAQGGILADEMGMGKTLQAIALVLFKRSISKGSFPTKLRQIKGTLVICPSIAVMQWAREIDRFTSKGSTKVLVYYGPDRGKNLYQLSDYDFVITTYGVVGKEYRNYVMPPKECQSCGELFRNLKGHLSSCCGDRTVKPNLEVHNKNVSGHKELENDNSNGSSDRTSSEGKHILHHAIWQRIVLDEAHCIKTKKNNTTRAVLALQSTYKWALSGTPLQNNVNELYSLIRFLRIVPLSFYCCRGCNCNMLDLSSAGCPGCGHKSAWHFSWWKIYIHKPIVYDSPEVRRGSMMLLKHKILKSLMLRRTKEGRAADLALPSRIVTLRRYSLDAVEEDYYTALNNNSRTQFNVYVNAGTLVNNYMHILALLTRLRQALDHPYLVEYSPASMKSKGKAVDFTTNKDGKEQKSKTTIKGFRQSSILNRIQLEDFQDFQTSTKIEALREEIRFMIERDSTAKAIVFSQFSSFLDLIHYALQESKVNCVNLDGSMSMEGKDTAIKKFTEDPNCRVILMALKAGGVALNLTVASHVFMMDPCWNPAIERQAQDRIHRIGQYKPIRIVKFIIENTIEEKVLKLQEQKELTVKGILDGSSEALENLTTDDLIFLFVP